jgi:hypothetical protein
MLASAADYALFYHHSEMAVSHSCQYAPSDEVYVHSHASSHISLNTSPSASVLCLSVCVYPGDGSRANEFVLLCFGTEIINLKPIFCSKFRIIFILLKLRKDSGIYRIDHIFICIICMRIIFKMYNYYSVFVAVILYSV